MPQYKKTTITELLGGKKVFSHFNTIHECDGQMEQIVVARTMHAQHCEATADTSYNIRIYCRFHPSTKVC